MEGERRPRAAPLAHALSAVGLFASCMPMVSMLPGAVAGALAIVGLGASSAAVTTLAPALDDIAEPLLLVSAALLAVSGLRCSRAAVAVAAMGGLLLYVSMYVFTGADGMTSPALFYSGLALFVGAYGVRWRRRRTLRCRPVVRAVVASRLLAGTAAVGILAVVVTAATAGSESDRRGEHSTMERPSDASRDDSISPGQTMPGMTR